jgi:hypothetical protein
MTACYMLIQIVIWKSKPLHNLIANETIQDTRLRGGTVAQVVEYLLSKHDILSSKPQYHQKKKRILDSF